MTLESCYLRFKEILNRLEGLEESPQSALTYNVADSSSQHLIRNVKALEGLGNNAPDLRVYH